MRWLLYVKKSYCIHFDREINLKNFINTMFLGYFWFYNLFSFFLFIEMLVSRSGNSRESDNLNCATNTHSCESHSTNPFSTICRFFLWLNHTLKTALMRIRSIRRISSSLLYLSDVDNLGTIAPAAYVLVNINANCANVVTAFVLSILFSVFTHTLLPLSLSLKV